MAKVLVIDDNAANRELIVTLLEHRKHLPLQAADGAEGLGLARAEHPQLIISDILMPTMDGFEFVRQLRADRAMAATEVIFCSAHYQEREAHGLATACGVSRVLIKPCEPEDILRAIDEALGHPPQDAAQTIAPEFDREHLRVVTDKLSQKAAELQAANLRLAALHDLNLSLSSERDPQVLLRKVCRGARDLIGAKYAFLAVREKTGDALLFSTSGIDAVTAARLEPPRIDAETFQPVLKERRVLRLANLDGNPAAAGLPPGYPPVHSALTAPIASLSFVYGWICLVDKLGAPAFNEEDERVLSILAAQVGRIYENGSLYVEVERRATQLQLEIAERKQAESKIQRLNRVYAVLSGINSLIVRATTREELFKEACRLAVEHGRFRLAWVGWLAADGKKIKPVAWAGTNEGFAALVRTSANAALSRQYSLVASAIDSQQPVVCNDIEVEAPRLLYGEKMSQRGYRSAAALPLILDGKAVGSLALYAHERGFFDAEEMRLLKELAGDVSFALDHIAKLERIDFLAYYDALTGIANRTLFHERLSQFVGVAARGKTRLALVIADLERLDVINDSYGRHVGDQLLKQLAARLVQSVGNPNEVARVGASHFAIVIPEAHQESEVLHRIEHWWQNCFDPSFAIDGIELRVVARGGIALFPSDGEDPDTLLKNAEAALKRARATAHGYLLYTQEMNERMGEKLALENKLRRALEHEEFVLHYQPKVDLTTRRITGVEALIRWQSPELGLVPPVSFIPILEETGMIMEAGAWALRQASLDRSRWLDRKLDAPRIAVNVSPVQLRREDFVRTVANVLKVTGPQAGIDIEITESSIMGDIDNNTEKLKAIRALGIGIAIDDFGTGYSSLGYLARLPVDTLKIDRSFIAAMGDDPNAMTLVSTMISLAHSLNLRVIAEGVESEDQAKILRLLRCDQMQGYLMSKPLSFDDMTARLVQTKS